MTTRESLLPRDLGARDDGEGDVEARHGSDRVVEAEENRVLEVQPADLGERVHEAVEHARRRGRKEEEDRLRSDVRKQTGAAEPVVPVVAAPEEQDEPADRERHVEEAVADVEAVNEARVAQKRTLHRGLDVEPKTLLAGDDALAVLARALPPTPPQHEAPHEQVEP